MRFFLLQLLLLGYGLSLVWAKPDLAGFQSTVLPLFEEYCLDCHDSADAKGKLSLEDFKGDLVGGPEVESWIKILDQITLRQMPPAKKSQPSREEREHLIRWIREELGKGGRFPEDKLQRPGYGNYVEHELLFGKEDFGPASSPPRLWRIRPQVHRKRIHALAKNAPYVQPFTLNTGGHGFRDYARQYQLSGADLNQLMANASAVAAYLTATTTEDGVIKRANSTPGPVFELLSSSVPPEDSRIEAVIAWLLPRVLLRDPTPDEMARYTSFARRSIAVDGALLGTRNLISALLLSPEGLYRSEQGSGTPNVHGRVRLSPREIAFAVAYSLTDARPDAQLLKAADDQSLAESVVLAAEVTRMLNDVEIAKPRILAFFREYFEYEGALDVFKDEELFRDHFPEFLVADTDRLIMHLYDRDEDVLKNLLTSKKAFVQYDDDGDVIRKRRGKRDVHKSYSLPPDWKWIPDQPLDLPARQRAGILTQPAWLVAKSGNFDNHAIWRGLWVRTKLLGGTIPDLPINVDAQLPEDPKRTLRDRMEVTREDYCWKCHQKMDPLGLTFEMFDHFGRWRTRELGKPVDSSGRLDLPGDSTFDGEVSDAVTLLHQLADSPRVRQVFVRHVFRFFLGRNETLQDASSLRQADQAYLESGGSMKALITSILTSDSFIYRKTRAAPWE